jgi:VWFA-related protein
MIRLIFSSFFVVFFCFLHPVEAQNPTIKFNFDAFSPGTKVSINQVETTSFPRVKLFASVSTGGLPLVGLTSENFRVRENNIDQTPVKVSLQRDAISAVLLLDVSGSMKDAIGDVKVAAIGFLKTLEKNDRVQVITFHERIDTIYPLGNDFAAAEAAISKIRHRGDTALYDGVFSSITSLREVTGRRAVIVLSDGVDDDGRGKQLSKKDLDEPLMLAIQTNIPIYTVGLGSKMDAGILKTLAGTTGAEYVNAPTKEELEALYARIGQKLSSQYAIEYTTTHPLDNGIREVKLDYVIPSRKPFVAPEPVLDPAGKVTSYQAPNLDRNEITNLAKMAGVGKFANDNQIKPLKKFMEELPKSWPDGIPVYQKAQQVKTEDKKNTFSFVSPENAKGFFQTYQETLRQTGWSILSETTLGKIGFIKAYKGESEMTVGVQESDGKSLINIEFNFPNLAPILVEKNSSNQIIAADGRDVVVSAKDGVIIISGGCGKLTLSGENNQVQCDVVKDVEIPGNQNVLILGSLGKGLISGSRNQLAWGRGLDGNTPEVNSTGNENTVKRLE